MDSALDIPEEGGGFTCPTCSQSYSRAEYLRRHQRKHTEARPFPCANCPKTFARSDVLLRHRRRVHPLEAAEEEANKPLPVATQGPKKPSSRRRNRNAHRPYPAQYKAPDSAESDPDDGSPEDPATVSPDGSANENGSSPKDGAQTNGSPPGSGATPDINQVPELGWTSHNGTSPSSGSASSSSPSPFFLSQNPSPRSPMAPSIAGIGPFPGQSTEDYRNQRVRELLGDNLPPAAKITSLEAGAGAWAMNAEDIPMRCNLQPQEGELVPWGTTASNRSDFETFSQDTYNAHSLDLPFVPPNAAVADPMVDKELAELMRRGDWSSLRDRGVDIFESEYAIIDSESRLRATFAGQAPDPSHKFYIPPGLFAGCYTVPHWLLPPLQRLSTFAANSFKNIMSHLGIIHEPTFRLADAHAWVAFALCTASGHAPFKVRRQAQIEPEPWDAVNSVVRTEKTGMFVKLFARAGSKLPTAETFSGIQAMLIYNAQSFLSDNQSDRLVGDLFLSTVSKVARRSGIFDVDAEWAKPGVVLTDDITIGWRRWIRAESCRRTAWVVYLLDVQSSLESGAIPLVSPRDVRHLPLPAPTIMWNARSAVNWALMSAHPSSVTFTLDDALQKLFDFSAEGSSTDANANGTSNVNSGSGTSASTTPAGIPINGADPEELAPSVLEALPLGPFARLVMVITILRGLIEYGEGKHRGGYVVQRWITGGQNGHQAYTGPDPELFHKYIMGTFSKALLRWKNGWDFDMLCPRDDGSIPEASFAPATETLNPNPEVRIFHQDALPFWWMCQLLLNHMNGNGEGMAPFFEGGEPTPPRWVDDIEDGEGLRRLTNIDLATTFATARSLADPFTNLL